MMKAIMFVLACAVMMSLGMTALVYGDTFMRVLGIILLAVILIDLIYLALMMKGD